MSTNYESGHAAEQRAAAYLAGHGYKIRELNWKTPICEIDVVAERSKCMYFVEVKSRKNARQGYGLEYITAKKLKQMQFAAEVWVSEHKWQGAYQLAAVGIDGQEITFVDQLDV